MYFIERGSSYSMEFNPVFPASTRGVGLSGAVFRYRFRAAWTKSKDTFIVCTVTYPCTFYASVMDISIFQQDMRPLCLFRPLLSPSSDLYL